MTDKITPSNPDNPVAQDSKPGRGDAGRETLRKGFLRKGFHRKLGRTNHSRRFH